MKTHPPQLCAAPCSQLQNNNPVRRNISEALVERGYGAPECRPYTRALGGGTCAPPSDQAATSLRANPAEGGNCVRDLSNANANNKLYPCRSVQRHEGSTKAK